MAITGGSTPVLSEVTCDSETASTTADSDEDESVLEHFEPGGSAAIGNLQITNSSDVHIGNRTIYQGPVTIKQVLYANSTQNGSNPVPMLCGDVAISSVGEISDNTVTKEVNNASTHPVVTSEKDLKWWTHFSKRRIFIVILASLVISVMVLSIVLLSTRGAIRLDDKNSQDSDEQGEIHPADPPLDPNTNITFPPKLKIVSRIEWVAQPPKEKLDKLNVPVPYVIISHTATENCSFQGRCVLNVRVIQMFHIESKGWNDIGYNFLVGGDGNVYEGRGWESEGAHTYGYNSKSIGIAFIGTFTNLKPPIQQINACKYLIAEGVKRNYIQDNYKLFGASQLQSTESPGAMLFEELTTWPHWARAP